MLQIKVSIGRFWSNLVRWERNFISKERRGLRLSLFRRVSMYTPIQILSQIIPTARVLRLLWLACFCWIHIMIRSFYQVHVNSGFWNFRSTEVKIGFENFAYLNIALVLAVAKKMSVLRASPATYSLSPPPFLLPNSRSVTTPVRMY